MMLHMVSCDWCVGPLGSRAQTLLPSCQPWEVPLHSSLQLTQELSVLRAGLGVSGLGRKHCSYLATGH